jgi:hypothetical protein
MADILLTNKTISIIEKNKKFLGKHYHPKEDIEMNALVRFSWNKIGVKWTKRLWILIAPIVIISIISTIYFFYEENIKFFLGFIVGIYFLVNSTHFYNIEFLCEIIKKEKNKHVQ